MRNRLFLLSIGFIGILIILLILSLILGNEPLISATIAGLVGVLVSIGFRLFERLEAGQPELRIEYLDDDSFRYKTPHPHPEAEIINKTNIKVENINRMYHYLKIVNYGDRIARNCMVRIRVFDETGKKEEEPFSPLSRRFIDYKPFSLPAKLDDVMDFCMDSDYELDVLYFCSKACFEGFRRRVYDKFKVGSYKVQVQTTADELKKPREDWFRVTKKKGWSKHSIIIEPIDKKK